MNVVVELIKIEQRCSAIVSKILFKIQKKVSTANCQAERTVTCCLTSHYWMDDKWQNFGYFFKWFFDNLIKLNKIEFELNYKYKMNASKGNGKWEKIHQQG